jgi:hypothetical protein
MARSTAPVIRYDTIEAASTGRSRCVACREVIAAGALRLRLGWTSGFKYAHLHCAASQGELAWWLDSALRATPLDVPDHADLVTPAAAAVAELQARTAGQLATEDEREAGFPTADRITSPGPCLHCRRTVDAGTLGVLDVRGLLHLDCALAWAEHHAGRPIERWTRALFENTAGLDEADREAVRRAV